MLSAQEQRSGTGIHEDANARDDRHRFPLDRCRFGHAVQRLEQDRADRDQQQSGIGQCCKDRGTLEAISETFASGAPGRDACPPCEQQREDVGQIVPGIGDQRHRSGNPAIGCFDDDECGVENDADQEGVAEIGGGMAVPVPVIMRMAVARSHRRYR